MRFKETSVPDATAPTGRPISHERAMGRRPIIAGPGQVLIEVLGDRAEVEPVLGHLAGVSVVASFTTDGQAGVLVCAEGAQAERTMIVLDAHGYLSFGVYSPERG